MAKSKSLSPRRHVVRTYEELEQFVQAFAQGHLGLMILTGNPGLGKSRALKAALGPGPASSRAIRRPSACICD
jgi:hypothetical protein